MLQYELAWHSNKARNVFERLPRNVKERLSTHISALLQPPPPPNYDIIALKGPLKGRFRLKVGQGWRVIYSYCHGRRVLHVYYAGPRENTPY